MTFSLMVENFLLRLKNGLLVKCLLLKALLLSFVSAVPFKLLDGQLSPVFDVLNSLLTEERFDRSGKFIGHLVIANNNVCTNKLVRK